ncbi:MAG: hypothetical protein AAFP19_07155 [Bacteroidota bacterium]
MKKTVLLLTMFFGLMITAMAQDGTPKRTLKVGFGTAYLDNGAYFGKQQYLDYDRRLFNFMSIGLSASRTSASENHSNGFEQSTKAYQGDAHLFLSPVNNRVNRLKMGFGGSYRFRDHRYNTEIISGTDTLFNDELTSDRQESLGYSVMLAYEVFVVKHLVLGSKAAYQQYQNGDKVFFWGLNAGLRF